jgi:hypothetical protein
VIVTALLVAGLSGGVATIGVAAVGLALVGVARTSPRADGGTQAARGRAELVVAAAAALVGVVYLAVLLRAVVPGAASATWDAWAFWVPKAKTIYYFGGLDAGPGGLTSFANSDYPPLLPAFDAGVFAFAGRADAALLPLQEWLLVVAFGWAVAGLFVRRVRLDVLSVGLLLVLSMPGLADAVGSSLGDLPVALLTAAGAACVALWVADGGAGHLAAAGVLLAGGALTKKEGLPIALLLLLAAAVCARGRRRAWPVVAAAGVMAAVVPWHLWLRAHHVVTSGDYRPGDAFDPSYLAAHASRAAIAAPQVASTLFDPSRWGVVLPLTLLLAGALLRRRARLAVLPLMFAAVGYAGLVLVYWVSLLPIHYHLDTSVGRTVMPIVLVGAALLPLLLDEALAAEQRVCRAPQPLVEIDDRLEAEHVARG